MYFIPTSSMAKRLDSQKGAAAVELSIVLPVFIFLIFGTIEFGLLYFNQHIVTNAAREGARLGTVMRQNRIPESAIMTEVQVYAVSHLVTFGNSPNLSVSVASRNKDGTAKGTDPKRCSDVDGFQEYLDVTVSYSYEFLLLPFQRNLSATTTMRCE